jgi:hypothetical protein
MPSLLDFLAFKDREPTPRPDRDPANDRLRPQERDAAVLADRYPLDAADIESVSEYRLASLLQYPHY